MRSVVVSFLSITLLMLGCVQVKRTIYKRVYIPTEFDVATQELILKDAISRLKQPDIKEKILHRFPKITDADLYMTDIRWELHSTPTSQTYSLLVGIKDVSNFPDPEEFSQYFFELAKQAVNEAVAKRKSLEPGKP
jgi:hypothetical protein